MPTPETSTSWHVTRGAPAAPRPRRRGRRLHSVPIAVNLAPMIDVTFLLLIFFLVTTTFGRPEGILASKLPADSARQVVPLPVSPIVVRMSRTGPGPNDFAFRIDYFEDAPTSFEELTLLLRRIQDQPGFDADTPVIIKADDEVRWDHVVNGWNAAVRCGYKNIAFSGS